MNEYPHRTDQKLKILKILLRRYHIEETRGQLDSSSNGRHAFDADICSKCMDYLRIDSNSSQDHETVNRTDRTAPAESKFPHTRQQT